MGCPAQRSSRATLRAPRCFPGRTAHRAHHRSAMASVSSLPVTAKDPARLGRPVPQRRRSREALGAPARRPSPSARTRAEKVRRTRALGHDRRGEAGRQHPGDRQRRRPRRPTPCASLRQTGCDGVMLGPPPSATLGVQAHPRPRRARRGELAPTAERAPQPAGVRHPRHAREDRGRGVAAKEMRKARRWYIKGLPHSHKVREQANQTHHGLGDDGPAQPHLPELAATDSTSSWALTADRGQAGDQLNRSGQLRRLGGSQSSFSELLR